MGFIRYFAVKAYEGDIRKYIDFISKASMENKGHVLVYAVWLRAILQREGRLPARKDNEGSISPDLYAYPIMLGSLMDAISFIRKKAEGAQSKAFALEIWLHTLRAIIRPELLHLAQNMWKILLEARSCWDGFLVECKDEDIRLGIPIEDVMQTARLAKSIIDSLPPSQLFRN